MTTKRLRLRLEIALHRHGWAPVLALVALTACATIQWGWLAPLRHANSQRQAELYERVAGLEAVRQRSASTVAAPDVPPGLSRLRRALPPPATLNAQVTRLFDAAEEQGLRLDRSSFQYEHSREMPWIRVSIAVPVSGSYPQVRGFIESVMREHPNMSLDQLSIKRDAPGQTQADVLLGFSAWFAEAAVPPPVGGGRR